MSIISCILVKLHNASDQTVKEAITDCCCNSFLLLLTSKKTGLTFTF